MQSIPYEQAIAQADCEKNYMHVMDRLDFAKMAYYEQNRLVLSRYFTLWFIALYESYKQTLNDFNN